MRRNTYLGDYLTSPYLLEGLHLLKNGVVFGLSKLFKAGVVITAPVTIAGKIELPFDFGPQYSGVSDYFASDGITKIGRKLGAIYLENDGHIKYNTSVPSLMTPDAVVIQVVIMYEGEPTKVNIHVSFHASVHSVWISPHHIDVCKNGFAHGFCLYVKFDDETIADVTGQASGQTGYLWSFIAGSGSDTYLAWANTSNSVQYDGRFYCKLLNNTAPNNNASNGIIDAIEVHLPVYLTLPSSPSPNSVISLTAKVKYDTNLYNDSLNLHGKMNEDPAESANIMFLSDGYKTSEKVLFETHVESIKNEFINGLISKPWGDLSNNINFWSLFTPSSSDFCIIHGECVRLRGGTTNEHCLAYDYVVALDRFIKDIKAGNSVDYTVNKLQNDYPILFSRNSAGTVDINNIIDFGMANDSANRDSDLLILSDLIRLVGFPCASDSGKSYTDKLSEWNVSIIYWNNKYASEFTHYIWRLMAVRIYLEQPDTALSTSSNDYRRKPTDIISKGSNFSISPVRSGNFNVVKRFIRRLKYKGKDIGQLFFQPNGDPTANRNDGKFLIILSKVPCTTLEAEYTPFGYINGILDTSHLLDTDAPYIITTLLMPKKPAIELVCYPSLNTPNYFPLGRYRDNLTVAETSVTIHEFTHNWAEDEYGNEGVYDGGNFLYNNLQSKASLFDTSNMEVGKIKWLWPRVAKIGVINSINAISSSKIQIQIKGFSPNNYLSVLNQNDKYSRFTVNDYIMLVDIFNLISKVPDGQPPKPNLELIKYETKIFPMFKISTISSINIDTMIIEADYIKNVNCMGLNAGALSQTLDPNYQTRYINGHIVRPWWDIDVIPGAPRVEPIQYCSIIHPNVIQALDNKDEGLVELDDFSEAGKTNQSIQEPTSIFTALDYFPRIEKGPQGLIVGLYAGGLNLFNKDIYHASGVCLMRNKTLGKNDMKGYETSSPVEPIVETMETSFLCPVCSYMVICSIDYKKLPTYNMYLDKHYPKVVMP